MSKVIYVGMDVHKDHTNLVCFEPIFTADRQGGKDFCATRVATSAQKVRSFLETISRNQNEECTCKCGYEAGCLGFSLYKELRAYGIDCTVLAPTIMLTQKGKRIKTDGRDAHAEKVGKLNSFLGGTTPTALAVVAETGDFSRFGKATNLAVFYILTPGELS